MNRVKKRVNEEGEKKVKKQVEKKRWRSVFKMGKIKNGEKRFLKWNK